jgi:hypothetical protein
MGKELPRGENEKRKCERQLKKERDDMGAKIRTFSQNN